ncbi:MAG TPA: Wadjet anti-phage system protein JetD domain-containing protein [Geomonas sp.]|nr:Wadjet anti-phage system protein JetD domain-containing protein [Geomonas sp.]
MNFPTALYHWGDLDLGGVRIMARIQAHLRRALKPHLMTQQLLELHGEEYDGINRAKLLSLAAKHKESVPLTDLILSSTPPRWLEQENIDPSAPTK